MSTTSSKGGATAEEEEESASNDRGDTDDPPSDGQSYKEAPASRRADDDDSTTSDDGSHTPRSSTRSQHSWRGARDKDEDGPALERADDESADAVVESNDGQSVARSGRESSAAEKDYHLVDKPSGKGKESSSVFVDPNLGYFPSDEENGPLDDPRDDPEDGEETADEDFNNQDHPMRYAMYAEPHAKTDLKPVYRWNKDAMVWEEMEVAGEISSSTDLHIERYFADFRYLLVSFHLPSTSRTAFERHDRCFTVKDEDVRAAGQLCDVFHSVAWWLRYYRAELTLQVRDHTAALRELTRSDVAHEINKVLKEKGKFPGHEKRSWRSLVEEMVKAVKGQLKVAPRHHSEKRPKTKELTFVEQLDADAERKKRKKKAQEQKRRKQQKKQEEEEETPSRKSDRTKGKGKGKDKKELAPVAPDPPAFSKERKHAVAFEKSIMYLEYAPFYNSGKRRHGYMDVPAIVTWLRPSRRHKHDDVRPVFRPPFCDAPKQLSDREEESKEDAWTPLLPVKTYATTEPIEQSNVEDLAKYVKWHLQNRWLLNNASVHDKMAAMPGFYVEWYASVALSDDELGYLVGSCAVIGVDVYLVKGQLPLFHFNNYGHWALVALDIIKALDQINISGPLMVRLPRDLVSEIVQRASQFGMVGGRVSALVHEMARDGFSDRFLADVLNHACFQLEFARTNEEMDESEPVSQLDCWKVRVGRQHSDTVCRRQHGEVRRSDLHCSANHYFAVPSREKKIVPLVESMQILLMRLLIQHMAANKKGYESAKQLGISLNRLLQIDLVWEHPFIQEYRPLAGDPLGKARRLFDYVNMSPIFGLHSVTAITEVGDLLVVVSGRYIGAGRLPGSDKVCEEKEWMQPDRLKIREATRSVSKKPIGDALELIAYSLDSFPARLPYTDVYSLTQAEAQQMKWACEQVIDRFARRAGCAWFLLPFACRFRQTTPAKQRERPIIEFIDILQAKDIPVAAAHSPVYVRHVVFHFDDVLKELNGNLKLYKRRDRVPSRDRDASSALKDAIGLMSWRLSMGKFAGRLGRHTFGNLNLVVKTVSPAAFEKRDGREGDAFAAHLMAFFSQQLSAHFRDDPRKDWPLTYTPEDDRYNPSPDGASWIQLRVPLDKVGRLQDLLEPRGDNKRQLLDLSDQVKAQYPAGAQLIRGMHDQAMQTNRPVVQRAMRVACTTQTIRLCQPGTPVSMIAQAMQTGNNRFPVPPRTQHTTVARLPPGKHLVYPLASHTGARAGPEWQLRDDTAEQAELVKTPTRPPAKAGPPMQSATPGLLMRAAPAMPAMRSAPPVQSARLPAGGPPGFTPMVMIPMTPAPQQGRMVGFADSRRVAMGTLQGTSQHTPQHTPQRTPQRTGTPSRKGTPSRREYNGSSQAGTDSEASDEDSARRDQHHRSRDRDSGRDRARDRDRDRGRHRDRERDRSDERRRKERREDRRAERRKRRSREDSKRDRHRSNGRERKRSGHGKERKHSRSSRRGRRDNRSRSSSRSCSGVEEEPRTYDYRSRRRSRPRARSPSRSPTRTPSSASSRSERKPSSALARSDRNPRPAGIIELCTEVEGLRAALAQERDELKAKARTMSASQVAEAARRMEKAEDLLKEKVASMHEWLGKMGGRKGKE